VCPPFWLNWSGYNEMYTGLQVMTPPNRFWPLYDDQEIEIYDNPFWDLPGRTRHPHKKKLLATGKQPAADR